MKKDTYRFIEITAVLLTGTGKLVYDSIKENERDAIAASKIIAGALIAFWIVYFAFRLITTQGRVLKDWGFRKKKFKPAMLWVGTAAAISICGFMVYGLVVHQTNLTKNILWSVLVYPFWGLVQQLLFISLVAGNLKKLKKIRFNEFQILAFTSILFCLVHYPDPCLMITTFFMAIFFAMMFLKYRNIYPLAIFHGVVGAVFYYFILDRDPWAEMITKICDTLCK